MRRPPYMKWFQLMFECGYSQLPRTRQFTKFLVHCLGHPDKRVRCVAAHHASTRRDTRLTSALVARATDPFEHPTIRGDCLESLKTSWARPWSPTDRKVHRAVARCLLDPDSYVRFWACYAAAGNRMCWLLPLLQTLTSDEEPGAMGETVGFEAREAIKDLQFGSGWADGFPSRLPPASSYEELFVNPYG